VGHNSLAASVLLKEFKDKKINLIYNCYKDKDYESILMILKPIIKEVLIIEIDDLRIVKLDTLKQSCEKLSLKYNIYKNIKQDEEYLVFGSFKVIEYFLLGLKK
jgi:dihydrofolate synthase/folylpolyglutamate synthase